MCGRFTRQSPIKLLATFFNCPALPEAPPRYNIAPTQQVLAVRRSAEQPQRQMVWLKWGLIPHSCADPKIAHRTINARSETAAKSLSAFKDRQRPSCSNALRNEVLGI